MMMKKQGQYVPLECIEGCLEDLIGSQFLKDVLAEIKTKATTPLEIFGELEFLFEDIEKSFGGRLEAALARLEASIILFKGSDPPKDISKSSIQKAQRAAILFSKTMGVDQKMIDALERVFFRAESDMNEEELIGSIKDLSAVLKSTIATVKTSLEKWQREREDILTEFLENGSEETQETIKAGLNKGIDALLRRMALERMIAPQFTNINALPQDIRRFVLTEIVN